MPVNWSDPSDIQAFRTAALENGGDPAQLDEYISSKKQSGLETTPVTSPTETNVPVNPPLASIATPAVSSLPTSQPETTPTASPLPSSPIPQMEAQPEPQPVVPSVQPLQTQAPRITPQPISPPVERQKIAPQIRPQGQSTILGKTGTLGTAAGVRQKADVFSGGINRGRDVAVPNGTPLAVPEGVWVATNVYDGQKRVGRIGDKTNSGWGNSVVLINKDTGEKIRMSHLTPGIKVKQGQEVSGGTVIGATGQTGNTSGPHLDIEYYDEKGRLKDIMNSRYGRSLLPS